MDLGKQVASVVKDGCSSPRKKIVCWESSCVKRHVCTLANFRSRRLRCRRSSLVPNRPPRDQVLSFSILKSLVVAPDRKSLSGRVGILDANVLPELTDKNPGLSFKKWPLINNVYVGFRRGDAYLKSVYQCSSVVDGCIVVDIVLQKATLESTRDGGRGPVQLVASNAPRCQTKVLGLSTVYLIS